MFSIERVVIVDTVEKSRESQFESPKVLAERAAVLAETNSSVIKPVSYEQYAKTSSERQVLKAVKQAYNKAKTNNKERESLVTHIVENLKNHPPMWGALKISLNKN
jgi:hypothetical protein